MLMMVIMMMITITGVKEIAVNDRMCPCTAGRSMIAITMYLCMWERSVIAIAC